MRIDAALADQLQLRQTLQQGVADLRPLADQHQSFGDAQPFRQHIHVLDMIVPDRDVMFVELAETIEGAQRVEIIVEDRYLHGCASPAGVYFTASSSTSNISVAFGGITPPAPRAP